MSKIPVHSLNITGVDPIHNALLCENVDTQELYLLANDDRLHAAIKGELLDDKPQEEKPESQAPRVELSPREIQQRVRAGQNIDDIVKITSTSRSKIERFAYPILMERSRVAQMALNAHPVRTDGPAEAKLDALVSQALLARGIAKNSITWDAWKSYNNHWIVQLIWNAGKSENRAHWQFTLGAHGGMVTCLDDAARELTDTSFQRTLQSVSGAGKRVLTNFTEDEAADNAEYENPGYEDTSFGCTKESTLTTPPAPQEELFPVAPMKTASRRPHIKQHKTKTAIPAWEDVLLGVRSAH